MNPFAHNRGLELKAQLVRAAIAAIDAVWEVASQAQFLHAEPLIRVVEHPNRPQDRQARDRPHRFRYVMDEVNAAIQEGVPIEGVCLYPILNHPGWDNDRHCPNGLWGYNDSNAHLGRLSLAKTTAQNWNMSSHGRWKSPKTIKPIA